MFDPGGILLGEVTIPPKLEVTEIGLDYVLGVHREDWGVERVQLHDLLKPERDP